MKKHIFVINGYPGSGKDQFVSYCAEAALFRVDNLLTSIPVKEAFLNLGWNGEKSPRTRKALAEVMGITNDLFDTSFKYIREQVNNSRVDAILFIHVREPKNIKRYAKNFNAKTILIKRDYNPDQASNPSDRNVGNYYYDYIIDNNGSLAELRQKAFDFMKEVTENEQNYL